MPISRPCGFLIGVLVLTATTTVWPAEQPPFQRPELVAMAWASPNVGTDPATAVGEGLSAWRPDGELIPADELSAIKKELREFGSLGKPEAERLAPLHLVFRIDSRARNSQRLQPALAVGARRLESMASQEGSSGQHLALSVLAPSQRAIAYWSDRIDVEIRVPIEEGDVFQTVSEVPDTPLQVAPGARLFWTKATGTSRSGQKLFPALALEIDRAQTPLLDYDFFTHLKDGTAASFNASQPTATHDVHISPPLDSKDVVDHVDLWRLRYRAELYDRLPTFPERIPK